MALEFLNPIFDPLLLLSPWLAILLVSLILSLIITLFYKLMTDQEKMKEMKTKLKDSQKKMKEYKDQPEKMMAIQKESMQINMQYMMQSMKPTIITLIPIWLIFAWLAANLAFMPIVPGEMFTTTAYFQSGALGDVTITTPAGIELMSEQTQKIQDNKVTWAMKGEPGNFVLSFDYEGDVQEKEVLIDEKDYGVPEEKIKKSPFKVLQINYAKLKPFGEKFNIFGWFPGWLGTYILFSLVFSMGLRKLLKLH